MGLREDEGLLPFAPRGFEGYRLVHEYFAMPERFLFFEFTELREAIKKCDCEQVDLIILLKEAEPRLENVVDAESFDLFCTPVINLFPKRLDPISLGDRFSEYHAVADKTRPLDFEIYQIQKVMGQGASAESQQLFQPFYLARDADLESSAYFNAHRVPRVLSAREKQFGATSSVHWERSLSFPRGRPGRAVSRGTCAVERDGALQQPASADPIGHPAGQDGFPARPFCAGHLDPLRGWPHGPAPCPP